MNRKQAGFTIIELMIALTVLSLILVIGSTILLQIGKIYNKGVNQAKLQSTNRTIVADVSNAVQFSGGTVFSDPYGATPPSRWSFNYPNGHSSDYRTLAYCVGQIRYTYVYDHKVGRDDSSGTVVNTPHALWRDTMSTTDCQPLNLSAAGRPPGSSSDGYDMIPQNMRLTRFWVRHPVSNTDQMTVSVALAYGDDDLVQTDHTTGDNRCQGSSGDQFCAISSSTNTVIRRLAR